MLRLPLVLLLSLIATVVQAADRCVVADPSNSPLNVRATPNGRVLGALYNGTEVAIVDVSRDGRWARIIPLEDGLRRGWVFRDFLDCR